MPFKNFFHTKNWIFKMHLLMQFNFLKNLTTCSWKNISCSRDFDFANFCGRRCEIRELPYKNCCFITRRTIMRQNYFFKWTHPCSSRTRGNPYKSADTSSCVTVGEISSLKLIYLPDLIKVIWVFWQEM